MRTLLSVAALALLAACASKPTTSKPLTLDQKLEKSGYELGGEIDKIQSWNVDGWNRIDDQHVAFSAGPSSDYLVTLMARSEEHTSELQSLMRISYAVFCWKQKKATTI